MLDYGQELMQEINKVRSTQEVSINQNVFFDHSKFE